MEREAGNIQLSAFRSSSSKYPIGPRQRNLASNTIDFFLSRFLNMSFHEAMRQIIGDLYFDETAVSRLKNTKDPALRQQRGEPFRKNLKPRVYERGVATRFESRQKRLVRYQMGQSFTPHRSPRSEQGYSVPIYDRSATSSANFLGS
jgi:hypothetical protein